MIDFSPGQNAPIYVTLTDSNGPVTGATVVVSVTNPAGTAIVTNQSAPHIGNGVYSYTVSSTLTLTIGTYFVTWTASGTLTRVDKATFLVGYQTMPLYTQKELRQSCLAELEDEYTVTGTVGSATSTTFTDLSRIEADHTLRGNYAYIYYGTGAGQERRVIENVSATGVQTVGTAFSPVPDSTSLYEEHKFFSVAKVNQAIKDLVSENQNTVYLPIQITTQFTTDAYRYDIPAGFSHIYAIHVQVSGGSDEYRPVAPGAWEVQRGLRKLVFDTRVVNTYPNSNFIIFGLKPPTVPATDSSYIELPLSFTRNKLMARLCRSKVKSSENDPMGWTDRFKFYEGLAEAARKSLSKGIPNNAKRVE